MKRPIRKQLALLVAGFVMTRAAGGAEKVNFVEDIKPILEKACVQCHGPDKQKGKLRLDTKVALLKGGDDGQVVEPGNPEKSDLYHRITLAEEHDDVMPPKGKVEHLTATQIDLVKRWITEGATWPDGVVIVGKSLTTSDAAGKTAGGLPTSNQAGTAGPPSSPAELKAIADLAKYGVNVRPIAAGFNWRRASFRSAGDHFPAEAFALLKDVANMRELNLGGVQIRDEDLAYIAGLKNLAVLHLDHTPVTDAGLEYLRGLENLTSLNLFGTSITDAGLKTLAGLKNLKSLYVAETKVTGQGVDWLRKNLPNVQIDDGAEFQELTKKEPPVPPKTPNTAKAETAKEIELLKKPAAEAAKPGAEKK